ncbi:MAG: AtpZ/AtpI family protein [Flavobacterium sp.]
MNQKHKPVNKWLQLIGIPIQMGVVIFLFASLGEYLDQKYLNVNHIYTKIVTILGVFVSLYLVIQQVNRINKLS